VTLEAARLLASLLTFDALLPRRGIAPAAMAASAATHKGDAPAAMAAAAAVEDGLTAATTMTATAAAAVEDGLAAATAAVAVTTATALDGSRGTTVTFAAAIATGLCCQRSRNRQSGDTCGEKQPGHRKISFRTVRTARRPHRSHS